MKLNKSTRYRLALLAFLVHVALFLYVINFHPDKKEIAKALAYMSAGDVAVYVTGRSFRPARFNKYNDNQED